jgi:hypothetical protein
VALLSLGYAHSKVAAAPEVIVKTETVTVEKEMGIPPVLQRIARAESGGSHFCTPELAGRKMCPQGAVGQVLVNDTLDVGLYQINLRYWGKWCADRGYDVFNEKQNEKCALDLFLEKGTEPWYLSKKNWQ